MEARGPLAGRGTVDATISSTNKHEAAVLAATPQTLLHIKVVSTRKGHPEASDDDAQAVEGDEEANEPADEGADARRAGAIAIDDGAAAALMLCKHMSLLCVTCMTTDHHQDSRISSASSAWHKDVHGWMRPNGRCLGQVRGPHLVPTVGL